MYINKCLLHNSDFKITLFYYSSNNSYMLIYWVDWFVPFKNV